MSADPSAVDRALRQVPLTPFVDGLVPRADDVAPCIGAGQRATPPDTVRRLAREAGVRAGHRVLELGSGTGFTAAVLAAMGGDIHGVERDATLVARARTALEALGSEATVHHGDGLEGWPEAAPYDIIVATFAVRRIPPAWLRQLAANGVLVVPVGPADGTQELTVFRRSEGRLERIGRGPARFAPAVPGATGP